MQAVGRILQIVGWLWFAAGFIGPILGYEDVNVFPGLILVFIARIFRAQAKSRQEPEVEDLERAEPAPEPQERPLNTERQPGVPVRPEPTRVEPVRPAPPARTPPKPTAPEPAKEGRSELLEKIAAAAGREISQETTSEPAIEDLDLDLERMERSPMSSDEMIARARRRWDRRP